MSRVELLREADRILRDNPAPKADPAPRFKGGYPALRWLAGRKPAAAAALWRVARERLPAADNDNAEPTKGMSVDRRPSGKARGRDPAPQSPAAYLALPAVAARLGDAPPAPARLRGWDGTASGVTLKAQRDVFAFHPACRFGYCAPAIAYGAFFLGAASGLGQPRPHTSRGDVRRVDSPEMPAAPDTVDAVIEAVLARADLAGIGRAVGAFGVRADRTGKLALVAAAEWAEGAIAA